MTVMQTVARAIRPTTGYVSMNLAAGYVPDWGPWEILREVVANAWDADPRYQIERDGDDFIVVRSRSDVFNWRNLTLLGAGETQPEDGSVRFREGFKLAALACVRAGGTMIVESSTFTLSFAMLQPTGYDDDVLHFRHETVQDDQMVGGTTRVLVRMPGIGSSAFRGRILRTRDPLRLEKQLPDKMRVFHQGVWVQDLNEPALWDWSFPDLEVDRDRRMADSWSLKWRIVRWLNEHADRRTATRLTANPECYETAALDTYATSVNDRLKGLLAGEFKLIHGHRAVVASADGDHNQRATEAKFKPVAVSPGIAKAVTTAPEPVLSATGVVEPLPAEPVTSYVLTEIDDRSDSDYRAARIWAGGLIIGEVRVRRPHYEAICRRIRT